MSSSHDCKALIGDSRFDDDHRLLERLTTWQRSATMPALGRAPSYNGSVNGRHVHYDNLSFPAYHGVLCTTLHEGGRAFANLIPALLPSERLLQDMAVERQRHLSALKEALVGNPEYTLTLTTLVALQVQPNAYRMASSAHVLNSSATWVQGQDL